MTDAETPGDRASTGANSPAPEQNTGAGGTESGRLDAMRELQEWLPKNVSTLPALVGLAGALAYGALNVASTIFYEALGVTPSDVGLGYGELLARVAVIGAIVGATALVGIPVITGIVHVGVRWRGIPRSGVRAWIKLLLFGGVAICGYDLVLSVPPPLALRWSAADLFALAVFAALLAIGVLIGIVFFDKDLANKCGVNLRYVLAAGVAWLLLAPLSFMAHAVEGAHEVQHGHRQRASLFGAPFPWQVTVASVTWTGPQPRPPQSYGCLLYLGSSGNAAVFYDPSSPVKRSIRVPTADVVVDVYPDRTSC
jgi:hypothetical protein